MDIKEALTTTRASESLRTNFWKAPVRPLLPTQPEANYEQHPARDETLFETYHLEHMPTIPTDTFLQKSTNVDDIAKILKQQPKQRLSKRLCGAVNLARVDKVLSSAHKYFSSLIMHQQG